MISLSFHAVTGQKSQQSIHYPGSKAIIIERVCLLLNSIVKSIRGIIFSDGPMIDYNRKSVGLGS